MRIILASALAAVLALLLAGCPFTGGENMVANAEFASWDEETGLPEGWHVEGEGMKVGRAGLSNDADSSAPGPYVVCVYSEDVLDVTSPFFFQPIPDPGGASGETIEAGAWLRTDRSGAVFVELSDRAGHETRSIAHTGSGRWEYLGVEWRVPEGTKTIELRIRFSLPGSAAIAGPAVKTGWL